MSHELQYRAGVLEAYPDVLTPEVRAALDAVAPLEPERRAVMAARSARRLARAREGRRIEFLDPEATIPRTAIRVQDARDGDFAGGEIPHDLQRQWIQGTGPATKPRASVESGLRNVAYALLSGADGWMFDGEDALGQVSTMSLDNQRNLKLAIARDPLFLRVAETVAGEMNAWATTGGASSTSRRRSSAPAACTSTTATCARPTATVSRPRSSTPPSTSPTTTAG
jgi:malate synthase